MIYNDINIIQNTSAKFVLIQRTYELKIVPVVGSHKMDINIRLTPLLFL
jgi:hypothetical protein